LLAPAGASPRRFAPNESMERRVTVLQVFHRGGRRRSGRMQALWQNSLFWAQQVA
jgi:anti-sigma-K factor RskA